MREILYRGFHPDENGNKKILVNGKQIVGTWVFGYYCYVGWVGKQNHYIIPEYASYFYGINVIPETIGQYTGLTDKNGKKIFEGDICRASIPSGYSCVYTVEFSSSDCIFGFKPLDSGYIYSLNELLENELGDEIEFEII